MVADFVRQQDELPRGEQARARQRDDRYRQLVEERAEFGRARRRVVAHENVEQHRGLLEPGRLPRHEPGATDVGGRRLPELGLEPGGEGGDEGPQLVVRTAPVHVDEGGAQVVGLEGHVAGEDPRRDRGHLGAELGDEPVDGAGQGGVEHRGDGIAQGALDRSVK